MSVFSRQTGQRIETGLRTIRSRSNAMISILLFFMVIKLGDTLCA
jgi:hypothetical protein